jgi:geranylgeranyl reductase family protein
MVHDLVVVGAGPAGAAAALTAKRLAPGADVAVVERSTFPRDKTCGDAISPDAVAELAKLGVADVVDGHPAVQKLRLRSPGGLEVSDAPPAAGYVIPRRVFDARLAAAARQAGPAWITAAVRGVEPSGAVVHLHTTTGVVTGRVVVGADGANSVVGRAVAGAMRERHVGVAVRGYAPAPDTDPEMLLVWERAGRLAYAWSFPVDGGRSNVGYGVFGGGAGAPTLSRARLTTRMGALLAHADDAEHVRGHRLPLSTGGPRHGRGSVLLAGDAAALINPITGEGIYYALLSGRLAAQAALRAPEDPAPGYRALLGAALGAHLRSTGLLARFAGTGPVLDHLVRAANASPATADLLADLAFGKGVLTPMAVRTIAGGVWRAVHSPATAVRGS